jgi:Flp pilus assembly protein TadB
MKLLAIVLIGLAVYFWFPLPRQKSVIHRGGTEIRQPKFEPTEIDFEPASRTEILRTLEIIQLGVSAGMTISGALEYAQKNSPLAAAQELEQGLKQFRIGYPLARGLDEISKENPHWRLISDTLTTSLNAGSPIVDQLADVAFILQNSIDTEKLKRIKSVAVKSVLPLGLCFLPAFILLAVVPIVAGLIRSFI